LHKFVPCREERKDSKGKEKGKQRKSVGEKQWRDGNLIGRAYSRRGVRATIKRSIFKCAYPEKFLRRY